jgi:hypothetical protein
MKSLLALLLLVLAGCGQLPWSSARDDAGEAAELLAYGQRAGQLSAEEQRRELAQANQAYARERSPRNRLRLALLLAQPGGAVNDDARAVGLLEAFAVTPASPGGGSVQQLGALLHAQVAERLKEQRRAQQMKEQIDALRALERNLIDRGQSKPR